MKKRFSEEQIIGFLKEAEAGIPVKELCRKHVSVMPRFTPLRSKTPIIVFSNKHCHACAATWSPVVI